MQWRKKRLKLLGVISDRELAKLIKLSYTGVRNKRIKLGIKPYQSGRIAIKWTQEMDKVLGTVTDKEAARKLNVPKTSIFLRRKKLNIEPFTKKRVAWTEEMNNLVGTLPDITVGKIINTSQQNVAYRRIHILRKMAYRYRGSRHYEEPWEIIEALCRGIVRIVNMRF